MAIADRQAVVDCALYVRGERHDAPLPMERALAEAKARDGFVWIGLHDPDAGTVQAVGEHFGLPALAVEDAVHAHQRPKLEHYGDVRVLVLKTARYVDSEELVELGEILVFAGERFVIAVRHGEGGGLAGVRERLQSRPDLLAHGPVAVLHAIADKVVDDYAVVIDGIDNDVGEVEAEVFSSEVTNPAERIYRLKREVLAFRRAVTPLAEPLRKLADPNAELPLEPAMREHFRDVYDHVLRDAERITAFDELLAGVLQANLAQLSVRDNQDMRRISAWVAIAAVPTMVFGLYGMNFEHMPELGWRFGYPLVLSAVALVCLLLWRRLRRAGWL